MATVKDHMTTEIVAIEPRRPALDAARVMTEQDVDALVVTESGHLLGMITQADLVRTIAANKDLAVTTVAEAMLPEVLFCFADQDVEEAAKKMQASLVRRLPVLSKDKVLLGMICEDDLAAMTTPTLATPATTSDTAGS